MRIFLKASKEKHENVQTELKERHDMFISKVRFASLSNAESLCPFPVLIMCQHTGQRASAAAAR